MGRRGRRDEGLRLSFAGHELAIVKTSKNAVVLSGDGLPDHITMVFDAHRWTIHETRVNSDGQKEYMTLLVFDVLKMKRRLASDDFMHQVGMRFRRLLHPMVSVAQLQSQGVDVLIYPTMPDGETVSNVTIDSSLVYPVDIAAPWQCGPGYTYLAFDEHRELVGMVMTGFVRGQTRPYYVRWRECIVELKWLFDQFLASDSPRIQLHESA